MALPVIEALIWPAVILALIVIAILGNAVRLTLALVTLASSFTCAVPIDETEARATLDDFARLRQRFFTV